MFGTLRTFLALVVAGNHTISWMFGAGPPAVFSFFCLSGFLMTLLVSGPYKGRPGAFFLNRFLRLYPLYWIVFLVALLFVGTKASGAELVRQSLYIVRFGDGRVIGPAWAVTNEICCYVLIALGLTRSREIAAWTFTGAAALTVYLLAERSLVDLYFMVAGAFFPFALGGLVAQYRERIPKLTKNANITMIALSALALLGCMAATCYALQNGHPRTLAQVMYLSLIPTVAIIAALHQLSVPRLRRADESLGAFSYPIYLTHELALAIGLVALPAWPPFASALIISALMSTALIWLVDRPVQMLRARVRSAPSVRSSA